MCISPLWIQLGCVRKMLQQINISLTAKLSSRKNDKNKTKSTEKWNKRCIPEMRREHSVEMYKKKSLLLLLGSIRCYCCTWTEQYTMAIFFNIRTIYLHFLSFLLCTMHLIRCFNSSFFRSTVLFLRFWSSSELNWNCFFAFITLLQKRISTLSKLSKNWNRSVVTIIYQIFFKYLNSWIIILSTYLWLHDLNVRFRKHVS